MIEVATAGVVTEYAIPTASSMPWTITVGPDGALWFTEQAGNKIGRITTGGSITQYSIPTASSSPWGITAGPGSSLWFTEQVANKVGRITTSGIITEYPLHGGGPGEIALGSDGYLWIADGCVGTFDCVGTIARVHA